jgi:hypothetical protein
MTIKQIKRSLVHIQVHTFSTIDWFDTDHNIYNEVTTKYYVVKVFGIPIFVRDRVLETVHDTSKVKINNKSVEVQGLVKSTTK